MQRQTNIKCLKLYTGEYTFYTTHYTTTPHTLCPLYYHSTHYSHYTTTSTHCTHNTTTPHAVPTKLSLYIVYQLHSHHTHSFPTTLPPHAQCSHYTTALHNVHTTLPPHTMCSLTNSTLHRVPTTLLPYTLCSHYTTSLHTMYCVVRTRYTTTPHAVFTLHYHSTQCSQGSSCHSLG